MSTTSTSAGSPNSLQVNRVFLDLGDLELSVLLRPVSSPTPTVLPTVGEEEEEEGKGKEERKGDEARQSNGGASCAAAAAAKQVLALIAIREADSKLIRPSLRALGRQSSEQALRSSIRQAILNSLKLNMYAADR